MRLRLVAIAAGLTVAHSAANAFFFFFLPTGAIVSAVQGDTCLPASAKEGDTITHHGQQYLVKAVNGTSSRCAHSPQWPVIGKVERILTQEEIQAVQTICVAQGVAVGARTTVPGLGEVEVRSLSNGGECSDTRTPVAAKVLRVQALTQPAVSAEPAPAKFTAPPPFTPTVPATKSTADRLRELKQLRDESLITQEVYESKQKDILSSQ